MIKKEKKGFRNTGVSLQRMGFRPKQTKPKWAHLLMQIQFKFNTGFFRDRSKIQKAIQNRAQATLATALFM
jgi:hypothetical protein